MTPVDNADQSFPDSDRVKNVLRHVFDSQIPNYGDYNLLCARRSPLAGTDAESSEYYVLGYRPQPLEIMVAPILGGTMVPAGTPVALNRTNLSHCVELAPDNFEVGSSTGAVFCFEISADVELPLDDRQVTLRQADDFDDFSTFMSEFAAIA